LTVAASASAQSAADLTRISVEDLMQLEVTSVSKKERPLATSPAAVFVLTQEDIRRSGLTSVPELLRLVPGLHVARIDGSKWAVTARGFNGRFANKLLVLVDGRTVYSPLYSGVYWDEVDLPLEDIERIEVIRGPGSTMWGANAVNGVVNVITRSADSTLGTSATLTTGSEDRAGATVRYGGTLGDGLTWRAWGRAFDRQPLARADGTSARDGWRMGRGGFRADFRPSDRDSFTLQGDAHTGREDQMSGVATLAPPYRVVFAERAEVAGRNVVARWTRMHGDRSETNIQVFGDHTSRREFLLGQKRTTYDLDVQHRQALGARHDLVWGLGYRRATSNLTNSTVVRFDEPHRHEWLASAFAEDEIAVVPERLTVTLGLKVERNSYTGMELQPNLRALWSMSDRASVWGAATRGVRTPSLLENGAHVDIATAPSPVGLSMLISVIGSGTPEAERLWATEVGYRRHWSTVSLDVSAFRNDYAHLLSLTPGTPDLVLAESPFLRMPYLIDAALTGRAYGVEAAGTWRARQGWTLTASYTYLTLDLTSGGVEQGLRYEDTEDDSPRHQVVVRSLTSIGPRWEADGSIHTRSSSDGARVPAQARVDLRVGYKATNRLTVSLAGLNLIDGHAEFLSILNEEISQPRRSVVLQTAWSF
jgi:iron complex outermembrane receptor protein